MSGTGALTVTTPTDREIVLRRAFHAPRRLVYTELFDDQSYPGESLVTHVLVEHDGRTTLTSTVLYASREGRDIVLAYPMERGVAEAYDRLAELLQTHLDGRGDAA
jgi:uncharacterized protein YndB with AHSA1/START domain